MLIRLQNGCTPYQESQIHETITAMGFSTTAVVTQVAKYIVCSGSVDVDIRQIGALTGVADIHHVDDESILVSKQWKVKDTSIDLGDGVTISRNDLTIALGPCAIESEQQIDTIVNFLGEQGVRIMRGGVFKPRSSPYAFRGLGLDGLKLFSAACRAKGIKVVTEVMQVSQIEAMYPYVDVFQVGTRNAQNFNLLEALGKQDKPVLLKRGMSSTIAEFLAAAEYVFSSGNERIILCERGIRTFEKAYRNTLDLNAIPLLKAKSHLPVFSDPSHGVGIRAFVQDMALSSVMAGADGVLMEIHPTPERAFSDAQQTLSFAEAKQAIAFMRECADMRNRWFKSLYA